MEKANFFQVNKQYYYLEQIVVILKCFDKINMVKVKIFDTEQVVLLDKSAISKEPVLEHTVSIKMLGGI